MLVRPNPQDQTPRVIVQVQDQYSQDFAPWNQEPQGQSHQNSVFWGQEPQDQLPPVSSILWNGSLENSLLNSSVGEAAGPATLSCPNGTFEPARFLFDSLDDYEGDASSSIEVDSAGFGQSEILFARSHEVSLAPSYRTYSQAPGLTSRYEHLDPELVVGGPSERFAFPEEPLELAHTSITEPIVRADERSSQSWSPSDLDISKRWFREVAARYSDPTQLR